MPISKSMCPYSERVTSPYTLHCQTRAAMSGDTTLTSMTSNLTTLKKVQIKVEVENLHSDENLSDIDPFHNSGPKVFITRVHVGITGAIGNLPNTWDCVSSLGYFVIEGRGTCSVQRKVNTELTTGNQWLCMILTEATLCSQRHFKVQCICRFTLTTPFRKTALKKLRFV